MEIIECAIKLFSLFSGNENAYGEYKFEETGVPGKQKGKARTVINELTEDVWVKHLQGKVGLGIIPIRSNSTCYWGAIDIDIYDGLDLLELSNKLPKELVLCRSKSGGAHIYIFLNEQAPATLIRKKLSMVARLLNHPDAEIFPKQEKLEPEGIGNWINMPYFNYDSTTRYCIRNGMNLELEDFLAEEFRISLEELVAFDPASMLELPEDEEFVDAPPCLQHLIRYGFPQGSRNHALFSLGVYAQKKFITGWEDKLFEYNQRFMGPGSYSEVSAVIRSLQKKSYVYKCSDLPLVTYCDKVTCSMVAFGIKNGNDKEEKNLRPCLIDDVTKVICYIPPVGSKDDPYWVFTIDDKELNVTVDMIKTQSNFAREYIRVFHRAPLFVKDVKWNKALNKALETAEIKDLAPDAGPEGQLWIHIEDFTSSKAKAKVRDEILLGKPWHDDDKIYFRSNDLMKYLDQQRFRHFREADIWGILRRKNAKHQKFNIKGKCCAVWSIDNFAEQNEGFNKEKVPHQETY